MHKIEYASLNYYNNAVSDECLCVGILFHNLSTGKCDFRHISNYKRFQAFDDEVDIDFIKLYLAGIKNQVETNIFNYARVFSISDFKKIYVNQFRFSDIHKVEYEENEDYVDILSRLYLKYDLAKSKRLSNNEEKRQIRRILENSSVPMSVPRLTGLYEETVHFDFVLGKVAIKLFSFKDKDVAKLIPSVKQWAFSAGELKSEYKIVFLYDFEDDNSKIEMVLKILKKNAEVYQIQDGIDQVLRAIS